MLKTSILIVIDNLEIGGAQHLVADLLKYSDSQRFLYHVAVLSGGRSFEKQFRESSIPLTFLDMPKFDPRVVGRLVAATGDFRPDIVHTYLYKANVFCARLKQAYGARLVVSDQSRTYDSHIRDVYFPHKVFSSLYFELFKRQVRSADRLLVLSEEDRREYTVKLGVSADSIHIIPNGVDQSAILKSYANPDELKAAFESRFKLNLNGRGLIVGFAGRLSGEKGCLRFVEGIGRLRELGVPACGVMAGDGDQRQAVQEAIRDLRLEDYIILVGFVPHREMDMFFASIDLFWLPSTAEPFGIVLVEAMARRVPTLSFRTGGPVDIVAGDNSNGILLDEFTGAAMAEETARLVQNPERLESMAENAFKTVTAKYDVRVLMKQYEEIYSALACQPPHAG